MPPVHVRRCARSAARAHTLTLHHTHVDVLAHEQMFENEKPVNQVRCTLTLSLMCAYEVNSGKFPTLAPNNTDARVYV